jgi:hypothetical protein
VICDPISKMDCTGFRNQIANSFPILNINFVYCHLFGPIVNGLAWLTNTDYEKALIRELVVQELTSFLLIKNFTKKGP